MPVLFDNPPAPFTRMVFAGRGREVQELKGFTDLVSKLHDPREKRLCRKVVFLGVFPLFSSPVVRGENSGMINLKGSQFEQALILWGVRWYVA